MRIAGFGTYDRTKHPRVGILLDGLRELGDDVTQMNRPLGFTTAERVEMLQKPWRLYRFLLRLVKCWLALVRCRVTLRRRPDAIVVGYLGHFDVLLARLLFPRTTIVLDLLIFAGDTARDRGVAGPRAALLDTVDRIAVRCADLVLVDTDENAELVTPAQRTKVLVVPVGSPASWFDSPRHARPQGPLRVIFFGLFTPLQGAPVIGDAIAELNRMPVRGDLRITMVGDGQDLAEARRRAGDARFVEWLDWVQPADLIACVAGHDVCLGIFGTTSKALRVVPNKVFQGAAAGCAIITSDTAPQRRVLEDHAVFVEAGDASALARAIADLADNAVEVALLQQRASQWADQQFRPAGVAQGLYDALHASEYAKEVS